jgi:plastocyanin
MTMNKGIWAAIGLIVILAVAAVVVFGRPQAKKSNNQVATTQNTPTPTPAPKSTPAASTSQAESASVTMTYNQNGFSPVSVTIKSGQTVTLTNNSSRTIQVDSNPHPAHTDDTDLNIGRIDPGQGKTATLTKMGTFGIHNHLNPSDTAQITIQ